MNLPGLVQGFTQSRGINAYLVGGTVRDLLLGRERYDVDVAVEGNATSLARAFADESGGLFYIMSEEFDTARVLLASDDQRLIVDFATLRGGSVESDLAMRDFSVNAMALDLAAGLGTSGVIDPFQGLADLEKKELRSIADSVFANDPVRLLRAARFEATLGFGIEPHTEARIRRDASLISRSSPERIRDEFYKILAAENPAKYVKRLDDHYLLEHLLPDLVRTKGVTQTAPHIHDVFDHSIATLEALSGIQRDRYSGIAGGAFAKQLEDHFNRNVAAERRRGVLLRLSALLHDIGKPATVSNSNDRIHFYTHENVGSELAERILRGLRFSNEEINLVSTIVKNHLRPLWFASTPRVSDRSVYRYFRATGEAGVDIAVMSVCDQRATMGSAAQEDADVLIQPVVARLLDRFYNANQQVVEPPRLLNGADVMKALAMPPGPRIGEILEAVREAQVIGAVSTRDAALEFIRRMEMEEARESGESG